MTRIPAVKYLTEIIAWVITVLSLSERSPSYLVRSV